MSTYRLPWIAINLLAFSATAYAQFTPAPGSPFSVGTAPISVAVGDFNGDGELDLAIANEGPNTVTVLLGTGTGGFTTAPGSPFPAGILPHTVVTSDFNNDGNLDLAVANQVGNSVTVLLGNGAGGFAQAASSPFPVGLNPGPLVAGNFNGGGNLDLVTGNVGDVTLTVLLGDGTGGFSPGPGSPIQLVEPPLSLAVGDFNGDGKPDLAIANEVGNNVTVLLGDGTSGFTQAQGSPFPVGGSPDSVAVADFNGDGKPDLVIANSGDNTVTVLLGDGTGGFTQAQGSPFPVGAGPSSVAVGDFSGDGVPDLAVANSDGDNVTVLLGNGTGGFTQAQGSPFQVGGSPACVTVGDFNGDGKPDLAIANMRDSTVTVLLNTSATVTGSCALMASPQQLAFQSSVGGLPDQLDVNLTVSAGCGSTSVLVQKITSSAPWLSLLGPSVSAPLLQAEATPWVFQATPAGLQAGPSSGTITFAAPGASNSPLNVPVTFTVANLNYQPLPDAVLNQFYSASVGEYACSLASGSPPPGLNVTVISGVCTVSGYALSLGPYQFTINYPGGQTGFQITVDSSGSALQVTPSVSATSSDTSTAPVVLPPITVTNTGTASVSFDATVSCPSCVPGVPNPLGAGSLYSITPTNGLLGPSGSTGSPAPSMQLTLTFNPLQTVVLPGFYTATYTVTEMTDSDFSRPAGVRFAGERARSDAKRDVTRPRTSSGAATLSSGTALNNVTANLMSNVAELDFTALNQVQDFTISDASSAPNVMFSENYGGSGAVTVPPNGTTTITLPATANSVGPAPGPNYGAITINCTNVPCENSPIIGVTLTPKQQPLNNTLAGSFTHFAFGAGQWTTTFTLLNTGTSTENIILNFYDGNGTAIPVPLTFPQGTIPDTTTASFTTPNPLSAGAGLIVQTTGLNNSLMTGSAQLLSNGPVGGFAVFTDTLSATQQQQAVVPLQSVNFNAYLVWFDNTNGFSTAIALANVSTQTANITVVMRDDAGNTLLTQTIPLAGLGHTSFSLTDSTTWPPGTTFAASQNVRGSLEFDTPAGGQISVLGLSFNPASAFTSVPAVAK